MLDHWRRYGFGWRCVIENDSGEWIGAVGLNYIGDNPTGLPPDGIEFGWWLKPDYWGQGFATEAAIAVRDEAFADEITDDLWARHTVRNTSSGRIMEKIGMTYVRDGPGFRGTPMKIYELRRDRWMALKERP